MKKILFSLLSVSFLFSFSQAVNFCSISSYETPALDLYVDSDRLYLDTNCDFVDYAGNSVTPGTWTYDGRDYYCEGSDIYYMLEGQNIEDINGDIIPYIDMHEGGDFDCVQISDISCFCNRDGFDDMGRCENGSDTPICSASLVGSPVSTGDDNNGTGGDDGGDDNNGSGFIAGTILPGGKQVFSGTINNLNGIVKNTLIPLVVFLLVGILGLIIGFEAVKRLISYITSKVNSSFTGEVSRRFKNNGREVSYRDPDEGEESDDYGKKASKMEDEFNF